MPLYSIWGERKRALLSFPGWIWRSEVTENKQISSPCYPPRAIQLIPVPGAQDWHQILSHISMAAVCNYGNILMGFGTWVLSAGSDEGQHCQHLLLWSLSPERQFPWELYIFIERQIISPALGFRLFTPVQLPLAAHPQKLFWELFLPAPHCAPLPLGAWGGSLPPQGSQHGRLGQEEEPWNSCWGRSTEALQLPACCVSKTTPISGPLSASSVNNF